MTALVHGTLKHKQGPETQMKSSIVMKGAPPPLIIGANTVPVPAAKTKGIPWRRINFSLKTQRFWWTLNYPSCQLSLSSIILLSQCTTWIALTSLVTFRAPFLLMETCVISRCLCIKPVTLEIAGMFNIVDKLKCLPVQAMIEFITND